MTTYKMAHKALVAAGFPARDITDLVRGIKADAWDRGADAGRRIADKDTTMNLFVFDENPYRKTATRAQRNGERP